MKEVKEFKVLEKYKIWLRFDDGTEKVVDLQPFLGKGFTKELLEFEEFSKISINPEGALVWENGFDACPNFLAELPDEQEHKGAA